MANRPTPSNVTIRPYRKSDWETLVAFEREFGAYLARIDPLKLEPGVGEDDSRFTRALLNDLRKNRGVLLFALVDGVRAGYIAGVYARPSKSILDYNNASRKGDAYVNDLFVDPSFRGRGIGGKLMHALQTHFRRKGAKTIGLGVFGPNATARRFYAQQGFHERSLTLLKKL